MKQIRNPWYSKKALWLVIGFVVIGLFAANAAWSESPKVHISLGQTFANSNVMTGEASVEWYDWELHAQLLGEGETVYGDQGYVKAFALTKSVRPDWCIYSGCFYQRIGAAYLSDSLLVGNLNYRLGLGLSFKVAELEYFHYSSGGIHRLNQGVDGWLIRFNIPMGRKL